MRKTTLKKYDLETINIIEDNHRGSQPVSTIKDCKLAQEIAGKKNEDSKNLTLKILKFLN